MSKSELITENHSESEHELDSTMNNSDHSILNIITDQFVQEASNIPKRLYCPFCLFDFGFEFLLKNHIQELHVQEIKHISKTNLHLFTMDPCSYCHAKFYTRDLLPKHVIRKHQESILNLVSEFNDEITKCNFCAYTIPLKQLKLLFIHLENKHLTNFSQLLSDYNLRVNGINVNINCDQKLNDEVERLQISDNINKNLKPILKKSNLHNDCITTDENNYPEKTRRKLRFDLPDSSFSSITSDKENLPLRSIKKKVLGLKIRRHKKTVENRTINLKSQTEVRSILKDITSFVHDSHSELDSGIEHLESEKMPFKCGVCFESFRNNAVLLCHMKKKHGRIHFHPRYRCGLCKAKFFRNSYLIRHNRSHNFSYEPL